MEGYDEGRKEFTTLKNLMYYTIREEEALSELKNILGQLQKRNIYSKLNKIAKDEISTYTNMPFDIDRSLFGKKTLYTRGGFLSSRTVQKNFKGNIYTGYGIYEDEYQKGLRLGAIVGEQIRIIRKYMRKHYKQWQRNPRSKGSVHTQELMQINR